LTKCFYVFKDSFRGKALNCVIKAKAGLKILLKRKKSRAI
jgi:hypothetical protein